ncbi:MAG TPA: Mrp/NBP35 family ATP-binding protein [Stackebrandtia sp.]|jgi:ATP-binding protein involved in chromosome partitioning|uniref:Mrp/NBP35 family ATP-binding protein n=1 Tax=Stackebrandtia sp. TaxID=2023065 RepID=UPI002D261153|nr:Mrp/NBP35 family ATP-binding protein [Stackebrandtia sp.]HZE38623.1 Mrp/NBP35 family ATP-binding protein [Stackebrandtia sp.]
MSAPATTIEQDIHTALSGVEDPEIRRPITDLGMVDDITVDGSHVALRILLTIAGCPLKDKLRTDINTAVRAVAGVESVSLEFGAMTDDQRKELQTRLRGGGGDEPVIPFSQPGSRTRVFAVASGKGGVGKSSVTVNLAAALAAKGLSVGVVDADIYGHSVPRMLGAADARPTPVEDMIMPPQSHGVKLISIGMFTKGNAAVVWRGPMLHRALQQFLADVYWGELDVLLLDLPPGTGDIAISVAQLLPVAELLVVTTPQAAAAEVAERAGAIAVQTHQRVAGVVENMSWLETPDGNRMELFGSGGGEQVAQALSTRMGTAVPLLGQVPLDQALREAGDEGVPFVLRDKESAAARALNDIAERLSVRTESLAGKPLGLSPKR